MRVADKLKRRPNSNNSNNNIIIYTHVKEQCAIYAQMHLNIYMTMSLKRLYTNGIHGVIVYAYYVRLQSAGSFEFIA